MEGIFIKLLNLSIQASILITVVLLLRFILNKSPKSIKCLLWALVAIRLVCPFSIESKFSLAPDAEVVSMDNYVGMPNVLSKTTGSDRYVKGYAESYDHEVVTVEKKNTDPLHIFSIIWLGGVVILAVYALGSCLKIWRRVKLSIRTTENIYICDRIDSPFIFGIIKPRIYLPSRMNEEQKESVIAHERAHLKRLDHFWKPFGFGLLLVYWFNPLCWLAYILFCRDIELACDCLLYTSDAADDMQCVDLGGRRIIKKNFFKQKTAYEISECLVGSEMCIRDRFWLAFAVLGVNNRTIKSKRMIMLSLIHI